MKKKWAVLGLALLLCAALAGAPVPATAELKVGISGYVKLDIQYGDKIGTGLTSELPSPGPANTPLDTDLVRDNSQTVIDARQSRIRATFTDEFAGIKFSGRIETDFYTRDSNDQPGLSTSNSARLRLRHAFARADHPSGFFILAGQWFSSFMNDTIAQAELVDFNGPAGQIYNARQPQLRVGFRTPLAPGMGDVMIEADVEKHFTSNLGLTGASDPNEARGEGQTVPLFAGKVSWLHPRFQAEVAGAIAESKVIFAGGADETETAWGFQVSAQTNVFDPLTLFAHFQVNDGLGRLLNADFADAVHTGATTFENVETIGWYIGARFQVTPETSVNAVFGWHEADEIPGSAAFCTVATPGAAATGCVTNGALETHQSIHVNVIHKFWQRWQAGLEYRRFDVEAFNGTDGDVNFIHGALWFFF